MNKIKNIKSLIIILPWVIIMILIYTNYIKDFPENDYNKIMLTIILFSIAIGIYRYFVYLKDNKKNIFNLNNVWWRGFLIFILLITSWYLIGLTEKGFSGKEDVETYFWIFLVSLLVTSILWYLRTYDKLRQLNESQYFNALNLLSKKDEPQALRLAIIILLELKEKGVYKGEIESKIFQGIELKKANLSNLDLSGMNFNSVDFRGTDLVDVSFCNSNLKNSKFGILKENYMEGNWDSWEPRMYNIDFSNAKNFPASNFPFRECIECKFKGIDFSDRKIVFYGNQEQAVKMFKGGFYNIGTQFSNVDSSKFGVDVDLELNKKIKEVMFNKNK